MSLKNFGVKGASGCATRVPAWSTQLTLAVMFRPPQNEVLRIVTDMAADL